MPNFPQLSTGALSQYPVTKRTSYRTIINQLEDGSRVALSDPNGAAITWQMAYEGLSDSEAELLLTFFSSVEGRLTSFTFADPVGNLVGWSEELNAAAWQPSGLLTLQGSMSDPLGTQRATTVANNSAGVLELTQDVAVPGALTCCWSVYARSNSAQPVTLSRTSAGGTSSLAFEIGPQWQRLSLACSLPGGGGSSAFQLSLNPGASADLFGFQVDAQPAASQYVQTTAAGALYSATRFDMDDITVISTGPNQNSCVLRLTTHVSG